MRRRLLNQRARSCGRRVRKNTGFARFARVLANAATGGITRRQFATAIVPLAILTAMLTATTARTQVPPAYESQYRRVILDHDAAPESPYPDPLDAYDPVTAVRLIAGVGPNPMAGCQTAANQLIPYVAERGYDRALAEYREILERDDVALARPASDAEFLQSEGMTSRDVHVLTQHRMLRLPASVLARYRDRIDVDAARLLADGTHRRDPAPLRRLLREYRVSRHAPTALGLLGDLAFERGDYDMALDWWRQIVPLPSRELINRRGGTPALAEGVDVPRIHAKQALACVFAGRADASREIDALRSLWPEARGSLAGKTDAYHAIVKHWLDASITNAEADGTWPTFAGSPSRNRTLDKAPSERLWLDGPAWRVKLPFLDGKAPPPVWLSATRSLAVPATPFHPVIASGQILFSDGQSIRSFDLASGKPIFHAPPPIEDRGVKNLLNLLDPDAAPEEPPATEGLAFGLTVVDDRVFARLGRMPGDPRPKNLVCLDLKRPGLAVDRVLWRAECAANDADAYFDANPLVLGDRVYCSTVLREKDKSVRDRHLVCYDFAGVVQWRTLLAKTDEPEPQRPPRQGLLVASGSTIVTATQAGVVVACDSGTGRRVWAFRYPVISTGPSPRGASNCLAADGRVFLAPVDSPTLFCLDADTGRSLWERPWTKPPADVVVGPPTVSEIVDLLGVVDHRLIFTDRFRLQALDASTGAPLVWQQPSVGRLPSQGRGLLAGPWVFWPTADKEVSWRAVGHASGFLQIPGASPNHFEATTLRHLPAGNIVFGQGCLAVAGDKELVVYAPISAEAPALKDVPQARRDPATVFKIAVEQNARGDHAMARTTAEGIERLAPPSQWPAWRELIASRLGTHKTAEPATTLVFDPVAPVENGPSRVARLTPLWGPRPGVAPPIARNAAGPDVAVVLDGDDVVIVEAKTGVERERRRRTLADVAWIGQHGNIFVLAGREGLEGLDANVPGRAWSAPNPLEESPFWRLVDGQPRDARFPARAIVSHFEGSYVVVENGLNAAAVDVFTGRVATDTKRPPWHDVVALEGGGLTPFAGLTVAKTAAGREVWLVTRRGAEILDKDETLRRRAAFGKRGILEGETHGRVALHDPHRLWTFEPPNRMSLTGAAAHVLVARDVCLAVVPRNLGCEVVRLDAKTGQPLWTTSPFLLQDGFDVRAAVMDERSLICVHRGTLVAVDLLDGKILWKTPLPVSVWPWQVERFGEGVIAWPRTMAGVPMLSGPTDPYSAAWTLWLGRRGIGSVPIVYVAGDSGKIRQRIDVPHDRGMFFVNVQGPRIVVSASGGVQAWTGVP